MRRLAVISSMTLLAFIICLPTSHAGGKWEIGPTFGVNFATLDGDDVSDTMLFVTDQHGSLFRGRVGAFGRLCLTDNFAIQMELVYVQKGGKWEEEEVFNDSTFKASHLVDLNFIEIPLLVRFSVPTQSRISPFFFGGGSIGFNNASAWDLKLTGEIDGDEATFLHRYFDHIENVRKTQFNLIIGGGVGLELGKNQLEFAVSYSMGLNNAFEDYENIETIPEDKVAVAHYPSGEAAKLKTRHISVIGQFAFGL